MSSMIRTSFLALLLISSTLAGAAPAKTPPAKLTPCQIDGPLGKIDARCGQYEVWEDRALRKGRRLALDVVVVPARSSSPDAVRPDPVFQLAGGPGESATALAGFLTFLHADMGKDHDLVFVDARGTAGPGRLDCDFGNGKDDLQPYLDSSFPLEGVRRCRDELSKRADLRLYTTDLLADDLEEARAWLGYGKIDLFGGSYGTRLAQVYLKRHPEAVRSLILDGVVPMDEPIAYSHAAMGQRALDLVLRGCESDPACHGKFPDARAELSTVLERLASQPAQVEIRHPGTGKPVTVRVTRATIAEGLRGMLYNADVATQIPLLVHKAWSGDLVPLAERAAQRAYDIDNTLAIGMLLSVTCAEDMPFIDPAKIAEHTAGSFLGDTRVREQLAACAEWPRAKVRPDVKAPVRSGVPVLLVSGERDPVTPPPFAERAARTLSNATRVVVPYGGHGGRFSACGAKIEAQFLELGTGRGLDTSCLAEIRTPAFKLKG
jgi:pimeloyl-ACP methyl ester carboxylesterase